MAKFFRFGWRRLSLCAAAVLVSLVTVEPGAGAATNKQDAALYSNQLAEFWTVKRFLYDHDKGISLQSKLDQVLLAKAEHDECFEGIGEKYPDEINGRCPKHSKPKANQAYVWGMTYTGSDIWFGTMANTLCYATEALGILSTPMQNSYWVCEFAKAASGTEDWRLPKIYHYVPATGRLEEKLLPNPSSALDLLKNTAGLRSAGSFGNVVFLGGPSRDAKSVNLFAFDAVTGDLLGSKNFDEYNDIRQWLLVDGVLYVGMGNRIRHAGEPGGVVLKWTGNGTNLFDFVVVGNLASEAANLAEHDGRLCVSTWPSYSEVDPADIRPAGVFCSPPIPGGGLTEAGAEGWFKIWGIEQYDPEPVLWMVTGGGAIHSFNGRLFWGTMNVPFLATIAALQKMYPGRLDSNGNNSLDLAEIMATALGTHRSTSLFRATNVGAGNHVDLIYGETYLPKYDPVAKSFRIAYDNDHKNLMRQVPLQGASGVGNFFNAYTWSAQLFNNALYLGTFDWTQVLRAGLEGVPGMLGSAAPIVPWFKVWRSGLVGSPGILLQMLPQANSLLKHPFWRTMLDQFPVEGADLLRIESDVSGKAIAESKAGLGNNVNYGVRTLVTDGKTLFAGMANAMNLHPRGGWELIGLYLRGHKAPSIPWWWR